MKLLVAWLKRNGNCRYWTNSKKVEQAAIHWYAFEERLNGWRQKIKYLLMRRGKNISKQLMVIKPGKEKQWDIVTQIASI